MKRIAPGIALLLLIGLGCDSAKHARVRGKITVDGVPLPKGGIRLIPVDGKAPTAGDQIEDGEFFIDKAPVTTVRVEISYPKVIGQRKAYDTPDSPMIDITKEALPEKYNAKSELKKELTRGDNELNYDLKTK